MAHIEKTSTNFNREFIKASNQYLKSFLIENKVPYLELEEIIQSFYTNNPNKEFYIIDDDHPTKEEHTLFGKRISSWLLEFDL